MSTSDTCAHLRLFKIRPRLLVVVFFSSSGFFWLLFFPPGFVLMILRSHRCLRPILAITHSSRRFHTRLHSSSRGGGDFTSSFSQRKRKLHLLLQWKEEATSAPPSARGGGDFPSKKRISQWYDSLFDLQIRIASLVFCIMIIFSQLRHFLYFKPPEAAESNILSYVIATRKTESASRSDLGKV